MEWVDGCPVIGEDVNGDGVGQPIATGKKPDVGATYPVAVPQTTDEFDAKELGLQWQWHANPQPGWASLTASALAESEGKLRLYAAPAPADVNLWRVPNLLLQKFPAPAFTVTTHVTFRPEAAGERAGLVVMGRDYACVVLLNTGDGLRVVQRVCADAGTNPSIQEVAGANLAGESVYFRVSVGQGAVCRFSYSEDGQAFTPIGPEFQARKGRWIGAKVGLFCINPGREASGGFADFDWFRFDG
jgi:beta-xylosidase